MREPTDEQVAAFGEGWEAERQRQVDARPESFPVGAKTRAGLRAVFALHQPLPLSREEARAAVLNADGDGWSQTDLGERQTRAILDALGWPS